MMSESISPFALRAMYPEPFSLQTAISLSIFSMMAVLRVSGATSRCLYILGPKNPVRALKSSPTSSPISWSAVRNEMSPYCFAVEGL